MKNSVDWGVPYVVCFWLTATVAFYPGNFAMNHWHSCTARVFTSLVVSAIYAAVSAGIVGLMLPYERKMNNVIGGVLGVLSVPLIGAVLWVLVQAGKRLEELWGRLVA